MPTLSLPTPTGMFSLTEENGYIVRAGWCGNGDDRSPLLVRAAEQVVSYFEGRRTEFDLPLDVGGSELQRAVCGALQAIPFGETRTYGELAKELNAPAQAIGQACGGNPIALIIPCHRVLAAGGLGGFSASGGVETKVALLKHEGAASLLI